MFSSDNCSRSLRTSLTPSVEEEEVFYRHTQLGLLSLLLSSCIQTFANRNPSSLKLTCCSPPLHPGLWSVCFLPSLCQGSTTTCWSPLLRLSSFCGLDTLFSTASLLNFFSLSFCCLLHYVCPDRLQKLAGSSLSCRTSAVHLCQPPSLL